MPLLVDQRIADVVRAKALSMALVQQALEEKRQSEEEAARTALASVPQPGIVEWAERYYYTEETRQPIKFAPFQKAILRHVFRKDADGLLPYMTVVYSQPKKGGKTGTAGVVGRYTAETQGIYQEIYTLANDLEQAIGRIFESIQTSIELDPDYDAQRRVLPGRWAVQQRKMHHLASGSTITAIASEYKGAAGGNPSLTLWTEIWAITQMNGKRFWSEMTPVPTRKNSLRWAETYSGWEGESELLNDLMDTALLPEKGGRQMTAKELGSQEPEHLGMVEVDGVWQYPFAETTGPDDPIPCYVNDAARLFLFYDTGEQARRQPWQQGPAAEAYYRAEEQILVPSEFRRLHLNERVSAVSSFVPIEWWDACGKEPYIIPDRAPTVIGIDAGINSDTFGLIAVTRHPTRPDDVAVRAVRCFVPPPGGEVDFGEVEEVLREWDRQWVVEEYAYDAWQMHDMRRRLSQELNGGWRKFSQGSDRLIADKQLYDRIRGRRIAHSNDGELRRHILNANAKMSKEEDNKLRIIKKSAGLKIDLAVCLSMAVNRCLELGL